MLFQVGVEDSELGSLALNYSLSEGHLVEVLPSHLNNACLAADIIALSPSGLDLNDAEYAQLGIPFEPSVISAALHELASQCETLKEKFSIYAAQYGLAAEERQIDTPTDIQRLIKAPPTYNAHIARRR